MGAGIVILFWLVILIIFGFICLSLILLSFLGWKNKWRWLKWIAGIPAAMIIICGILLVSLIIYGVIDSMNPRSIFKRTFGHSPSNEVSSIQSNFYWFADTGSVYLTFKTTEKEFRRIVPDGLIEKTMEEMRREMPNEGGSEAPVWWSYRADQTRLNFLRHDANHGKPEPAKKGFYYEVEYFTYDPSTQRAYYRFLGID
jgi:hypothetical protein